MKPFLLSGAIILALSACQGGNTPREPESQSEGAISVAEGSQTGAAARVPDEAARQALLALEEKIMRQPEDAALRREFGAQAIDAAAGVIWTIGRGKIPPGESIAAIAQNKAKQAALLDASRWAAYVLEWQKHDYATAFGALRGEVPNSTIVNETFSDSMCVVLVKTSLKK